MHGGNKVPQPRCQLRCRQRAHADEPHDQAQPQQQVARQRCAPEQRLAHGGHDQVDQAVGEGICEAQVADDDVSDKGAEREAHDQEPGGGGHDMGLDVQADHEP